MSRRWPFGQLLTEQGKNIGEAGGGPDPEGGPLAKRVTSGLAIGTYLLYPPNFNDKLVISDSSGGGPDPEGGPLAKRVSGQGVTFGFGLARGG